MGPPVLPSQMEIEPVGWGGRLPACICRCDLGIVVGESHGATGNPQFDRLFRLDASRTAKVTSGLAIQRLTEPPYKILLRNDDSMRTSWASRAVARIQIAFHHERQAHRLEVDWAEVPKLAALQAFPIEVLGDVVRRQNCTIQVDPFLNPFLNLTGPVLTFRLHSVSLPKHIE
jgi:hypothetical protein